MMQRSAERPVLRVVVLRRTAAHRAPARAALPLPRFRREGRDPAVGRIDDERAALLAVDDRDAVAGVDPEVVVAADVAGRAGRSVAALAAAPAGSDRSARRAASMRSCDALLEPARPRLSTAPAGCPSGRSSGVIVALVQLPCRSGWPSGVRGIVHGFASGRRGFRWRPHGACARRRRQAPAPSAPIMSASIASACPVVLLDGVLAQVAVHQLFDELDALELAEPRVLVDVPVERHADRPRPRERLRVVDRRLVLDVVGPVIV